MWVSRCIDEKSGGGVISICIYVCVCVCGCRVFSRDREHIKSGNIQEYI